MWWLFSFVGSHFNDYVMVVWWLYSGCILAVSWTWNDRNVNLRHWPVAASATNCKDKSSFCGGNSTKATSGINGAGVETHSVTISACFSRNYKYAAKVVFLPWRYQNTESQEHPGHCWDFYSGHWMKSNEYWNMQRGMLMLQDTLKGGAKKPELAKFTPQIASI